ncbi:MAG: sugar ABC transporter substrate-binding protein [Bilifractor sp.]|jgi:ABC-type sugar transport system substrate-binding protein
MKKNHRRIISLTAAAVLMAGMLAGCGGSVITTGDSGSSGSTASVSSSGGDSSSGDKLKVAWIGVSASDESTIAIGKFAEDYAEEIGTVEIVSYDAQADPQTQVNCVNNAITQQCDAIMVAPLDATAISPSLKDAMNAGIIVLTCTIDVADESCRNAYVGVDDTEAGRIAAEQIVKKFPDGGKAVMVEGNAGESVQINRTEGFEEVLADSKVELIDKHTTEAWEAETAMTVAQDFLTKYDDIDAIYCQWDNGTVAVVQAIEATGKSVDDFFIVSVDGCYNGFDLVRDGDIYSTVMLDYNATMQKAIDLIVDAKNNGKSIDESYYYIDPILITSENVDDYDPGW